MTTAVYPLLMLLRLISQKFTTACFGSHLWRNMGKFGRLSSPSKLSVAHLTWAQLLT